MGRDLSSGGMRVAPNADLIVGDVLKLVIYGPAGRPPLVLRAVVFRDDGSDGCVLRFENLAPATVAELDEWTRAASEPRRLGEARGACGALHRLGSRGGARRLRVAREPDRVAVGAVGSEPVRLSYRENTTTI